MRLDDFGGQDRFGVNEPGHHPAGAAIAGAAATVFHDAIMTPMDVVKQRLQLGYHKGMLDCVLTIRRTEGTQVGAVLTTSSALFVCRLATSLNFSGFRFSGQDVPMDKENTPHTVA